MRTPKTSSLLFCFLMLLSLSAFAQLETNYWYFGNRAGLRFTGANPQYLTNSPMKALEGSATISDSLGNLLFYTAGDTVFNRFHFKMNNGWPLTGHQSASQSSIIVEQPYTNLYYLFTVDALGGMNSLKYSVVNPAANNLAGTVLAKNIAVPGTGPQFPVSEKITAVDHRHSRDVWVVAHGSGAQNDKFYAYRVTSNGIMPPVISTVGISHAGTFPNNKTIGYMKISPDGRKLVMAMQEQHLIELYDFNDSSGVVSNPMRILGLPRAYGVEFSRDASKLYVSTQASTALIHQFDLEAGKGHPDSVRLSQAVIGVTKSAFSSALQLANNGRIYIANTDQPPGNRFLSLITKPDSAAKDVDFLLNSMVISAGVNFPQRSNQGLPNFNQSYLWFPSFRAKFVCAGDQTQFTLVTKRRFKSVLWNFGDGTIFQPNTSTDFSPTHQYAAPGTYNVLVTVTLLNNRVRQIMMPVIIKPLPYVDLGPDHYLCPNDSTNLYVYWKAKKQIWSTGSTDSAITITTPGTYWVQVWNNEDCSNTDTIEIRPAPSPPAFFSSKVVDTCPFRPVKLEPVYGSFSYLWSTGSSERAITVSREGWYKLRMYVGACQFTDSVQVVFRNCPEDFQVPNVVTQNGDNANDKFLIGGFRVGTFSLNIFNRWGQLVYESSAYKNDWPKQKQGAGVYYYQLQHLENKQVYKGWIEVID